MTGPTCDDGEQILDITNAIGMAPGITQILFYEGATANNTAILNRIATDDIARSISSSWSWNPAGAASDDPIFQQFAAQGQTYFNAGGDSGTITSANAFFPDVDPFVTETGATTLTTTGPSGSWVAETGWPSSGGGFLSTTLIPAYQQPPGVINPTNAGSTLYRNSPDVALEGDFDNFNVDNGLAATNWGGTSFAAPRWAGLIAMANQAATIW
jgi:xanthomonalisin